MFGRHVVSGKVIAKDPYAAPAPVSAPAMTKQTSGLFDGAAAELDRPQGSGEWILRVEGIDQHGKPYAQNKYVDELEYNTTEIGDPWPST
jgi:hypothetical protein